MIIVGCDDHAGSSKLLLRIPKLGNCKSGDWSTVRQQQRWDGYWHLEPNRHSLHQDANR